MTRGWIGRMTTQVRKDQDRLHTRRILMIRISRSNQPLKQTHSMNHIGYKDFNSIQDPADKKIEERYSFLQEKVADAVIFLLMYLYFQKLFFLSDF